MPFVPGDDMISSHCLGTRKLNIVLEIRQRGGERFTDNLLID
jgi:hypothetical protein